MDVFHSCSHSARILSRISACSLEKRGQNECVLPGLAASLANLSAVSFPRSSQCPGTHWRRRAIPLVLTSVAVCTIAWMIHCPNLLLEFWIACSAALLSHRIVAGICRWVVICWFGRASLYTKLMAWNIHQFGDVDRPLVHRSDLDLSIFGNFQILVECYHCGT